MPRLSRDRYEHMLLVAGLAGLLMVFIPVNTAIYTVGWIILMATTLLYVASTLIPPEYRGLRYVYRYAVALVIILIVVATFIVVTIYLAPQLVK